MRVKGAGCDGQRRAVAAGGGKQSVKVLHCGQKGGDTWSSAHPLLCLADTSLFISPPPPSFLFIFFTIGPDFDSRCNHARTDGTVLYFAVMKKTVDSTVLDDAGFEQIYYHYARLLLDLRYATGREYFVRCIKRSRDESPFAQCPQKAAVNGIVTRLQGPCRDPTIVPPKSREMCTPFRHPRHGNGVELVARLEIWLIGQGRDSLGIDARHE
jgi:hypothetical protein